jgi:hypothetical protein
MPTINGVFVTPEEFMNRNKIAQEAQELSLPNYTLPELKALSDDTLNAQIKQLSDHVAKPYFVNGQKAVSPSAGPTLKALTPLTEERKRREDQKEKERKDKLTDEAIAQQKAEAERKAFMSKKFRFMREGF